MDDEQNDETIATLGDLRKLGWEATNRLIEAQGARFRESEERTDARMRSALEETARINFAAAALQGLIGNSALKLGTTNAELATAAFAMAESMMAERAKRAAKEAK